MNQEDKKVFERVLNKKVNKLLFNDLRQVIEELKDYRRKILNGAPHDARKLQTNWDIGQCINHADFYQVEIETPSWINDLEVLIDEILIKNPELQDD